MGERNGLSFTGATQWSIRCPASAQTLFSLPRKTRGKTEKSASIGCALSGNKAIRSPAAIFAAEGSEYEARARRQLRGRRRRPDRRLRRIRRTCVVGPHFRQSNPF